MSQCGRAVVLAGVMLLVLVTVPPATADPGPGATTQAVTEPNGMNATATYTVSPVDGGSGTATFRVRLTLSRLNESAYYVISPNGSAGATVRNTDGFVRRTHASGPTVWLWDGETSEPTMTLRVALEDLPADPWSNNASLVPVRALHQPIGTNASRTVDHRVVAADAHRFDEHLYFGAVTITQHRTPGHNLTFVTPPGVTPEMAPTDVAETIHSTNRTLRLDGPANLTVMYVPGLSMPGRAADDVIKLWPNVSRQSVRHEFVHTRQRFLYRAGVTERLKWFTEGSANYLAYLAGLKSGTITPTQFYENVTTEQNASASLVGVTDGYIDPLYTKGMRLVAVLDLRTRRATDNSSTVVDIIKRLNAREHDGNVTLDRFFAVSEAIAGKSPRPWLRPALESAAGPSLQSKHATLRTIAAGLPAADADSDRLRNERELNLGTGPFRADTDSDDLSDGREVKRGLNPLDRDMDGDGLIDSKDPEPTELTINPALAGIYGGFGLLALGLGALLASVVSILTRVTRWLAGIGPGRPANWSLRRLLAGAVLCWALGAVLVLWFAP